MLPFYAMSPLFVRTGAISAVFNECGEEAGLTQGEFRGAFDQLKSYVSIGVPLLYGRIYASGPPSGLYARVGAGLLVLCQLLCFAAGTEPKAAAP